MGQQIPPCLHPFDDFMVYSGIISSGKGRGDHTRENCQYKSERWGAVIATTTTTLAPPPTNHILYKQDKLTN